MSSTLIETLRALDAKATPGPWAFWDGRDSLSQSVIIYRQGYAQRHLSRLALQNPLRIDDAELIVALRNALPELLALASAPVAGGTWQPIASAPEDRDTHILAVDAVNGRTHVCRRFNGRAFYYAVAKNGAGMLFDPTHWMPLPASPRTSEEPPR